MNATATAPATAGGCSEQRQPGLVREAFGILERVAADKPGDPFPQLSDAVRKLVAARDALIARRRAEYELGQESDVSARLTALNSAISVAVGAQFPMVGIKRDRIEKARDAVRSWLERFDREDAQQ